MFDIGFMELVLIAVVALIVVGPEKLPGAIRTTTLWIGRAKRSFNQVKSEIEREKIENFGPTMHGRIRKYLWNLFEYPGTSRGAQVSKPLIPLCKNSATRLGN